MHTVKYINLKCIPWWIFTLVEPQSRSWYRTSPPPFQKASSDLFPLNFTLSHPGSHWWVWSALELCVNEILLCVLFCTRLLLLYPKMPMNIRYCFVCSSRSLLFPSNGWPQFTHLFTSCGAWELLPVFGCQKQCSHDPSCIRLLVECTLISLRPLPRSGIAES